ncbi:MAG: zinc ribbon domain-containing protein [Candidatus Acidiferrales bacterium]
MKCPKCSAEARDIARFCPRCHATLRYECPSCKHEQRHGGQCDKCGVDFLKYISAVVAVKKSETDAARERLEQRSTLMKNVLFAPFTMGIPLIRSLLLGSSKNRR